MAVGQVLIVLDRDGVLNRTVPNPSEARPDSPLRPEEVEVFPWVPETLRRLTDAGLAIAVASNQPAAAKGKATRAALEEVHELVCARAQSAGGVIVSSHVCYHRAEDACACRKPQTGLLKAAFARSPRCREADSWMVGDRATDVLAGLALGMNTALLADGAGAQSRADELRTLNQRQVRPSFCGDDLRDFADFVLENLRLTHD